MPICATCGVESDIALTTCPICADERRYIPAGGQVWVNLEDAASIPYDLTVRRVEPKLFSLHREPTFATGYWSMLVQTDRGNLLWDPLNFLDGKVVDRVRRLGGVDAIAASHPHTFGAQVSWSHAFNHAPVWVNSDDMNWLLRRDPVIRPWSGTQVVLPAVELVQCGGHFPGSAVLHWQHGCSGRGVLLTGDTVADATADGHVAFLRSHANRIPLSGAVIERIVRRLEAYDYERLYSSNGVGVYRDAKRAVRRSADNYICSILEDLDAGP
ncbi:MBL fold metallo-hydrolase [Leekyejoonella antrihumi]